MYKQAVNALPCLMAFFSSNPKLTSCSRSLIVILVKYKIGFKPAEVNKELFGIKSLLS